MWSKCPWVSRMHAGVRFLDFMNALCPRVVWEIFEKNTKEVINFAKLR